MHALNKMAAAMLAATALFVFGTAGPAPAAPPEATLDSFVPGAGVDSLARLKLKAKGTALQGTVDWDGCRLAATVRAAQGRVKDATLKGELTNSLVSTFMGTMGEKGFVPAAVKSGGKIDSLLGLPAEQSSEDAVAAMLKWSDEGKTALHVLFLPEKASKSAGRAGKASPKAPLGTLLKPFGKEKAYVLTLFKDDTLAMYIGTVEGAAGMLASGR